MASGSPSAVQGTEPAFSLRGPLSDVTAVLWSSPCCRGCGPRHLSVLRTLRDEGPRAYLLTGAEKTLWAKSPFADLLEDGRLDPVELCNRTLADKKQTIAWDDLLRGSDDSYPDTLPSSIKTRICGRAGLGDWELRAVEVTVADANPIPMDWGWPSGTDRRLRNIRPWLPLTLR